MNQPESELGVIGRAMQAHPQLMSGSDAFDGWLIQQTACVAKVGAQGILCMALPTQKLGLALKVRSGSDAVRPKAALAVLEKTLPSLVQVPIPPRFVDVFNLVGARVGEHAAIFSESPRKT
jgi:L-asparaginase II